MKPATLQELADALGIILKGENRPFTGLNTLEEASGSEVSFLSNPRYAHLLATTKAVAVFVDEAHAEYIPSALVSANPYLDFSRAASLFIPQHADFTGVSPDAYVHESAHIGKGCTIYPGVYIGQDVHVGDGTVLFPGVFLGNETHVGRNCTLYPHVCVMARVLIGDGCIIHPGVVLGADGFGFIRHQGAVMKIPQIGTVRIADRVEIGANACVDRATLSATRVGADCKIDNLVQLGHNVTLDEGCFIISQVGIAGSTRVGKRVTIAGQAGIAGHLTIGDDVTIGPLSGVAQDIPANTRGSGIPFMEERTFLRATLSYPKLPLLQRRVKELEKELATIKALLAEKEKKDSE